MVVRKQSKSWLQYLNANFELFLKAEASPFSDLKRLMIPDVGGVYLITAAINGKEIPYYVGRSKNLRDRIYTSHLMGSINSAQLKKYLVESGECKDLQEAKNFIKKHCLVRWIIEEDTRKRGAIEGYTTGLLFPKYGIYEEH